MTIVKEDPYKSKTEETKDAMRLHTQASRQSSIQSIGKVLKSNESSHKATSTSLG